MRPKHINTCVNSYPLDENDPSRNNKGTAISAEIYLSNPCHPGEWLCVASFLNLNALEFFMPPKGVPFAIYLGDKWTEYEPLKGG